jgi:hypothetical protein
MAGRPRGIHCLPHPSYNYLSIVGQVVGRKVVEVRICSCPKRDLQQEEAKIAHQEENARRIAQK